MGGVFRRAFLARSSFYFTLFYSIAKTSAEFCAGSDHARRAGYGSLSRSGGMKLLGDVGGLQRESVPNCNNIHMPWAVVPHDTMVEGNDQRRWLVDRCALFVRHKYFSLPVYGACCDVKSCCGCTTAVRRATVGKYKKK